MNSYEFEHDERENDDLMERKLRYVQNRVLSGQVAPHSREAAELAAIAAEGAAYLYQRLALFCRDLEHEMHRRITYNRDNDVSTHAAAFRAQITILEQDLYLLWATTRLATDCPDTPERLSLIRDWAKRWSGKVSFNR